MKTSNKIVLGKIEQGTCPYCGSNDVSYSLIEEDGETICYKGTCCNCERPFEEWYRLEFAGITVGDDLSIDAEEGLEIEDFE